mgnify:FL=1
MVENLTIIDISRKPSSTLTIEQAGKTRAICLALCGPQLNLAPFVGSCAVVDMFAEQDQTQITEAQAVAAVDLVATQAAKLKANYGGQVEKPNRILFRTKRTGDTSIGRYFSEAALNKLFDSGIVLVGVDTPSLTPLNSSQELLTALAKQGRACLINLELSEAPAGILYQLLAPPILISNESLVPVRAVLTAL